MYRSIDRYPRIAQEVSTQRRSATRDEARANWGRQRRRCRTSPRRRAAMMVCSPRSLRPTGDETHSQFDGDLLRGSRQLLPGLNDFVPKLMLARHGQLVDVVSQPVKLPDSGWFSAESNHEVFAVLRSEGRR